MTSLKLDDKLREPKVNLFLFVQIEPVKIPLLRALTL